AASWTFVTDSMSRAEVFVTDSMSRVEVSSSSRRRRFSSRSSASQSARLGPLASHFFPRRVHSLQRLASSEMMHFLLRRVFFFKQKTAYEMMHFLSCLEQRLQGDISIPSF